MRLLVAVFLLVLLANDAVAGERRVLVLGVDGMDHRLTERWIAEGRLPNLAKLAGQGTFVSLATSNPPQSPVAWSDFITGAGPGVHGIADFIHRDPATMMPVFSMSRVAAAKQQLSLGSLTIPLGGTSMLSLRQGTPFWDAFCERNVPAVFIRLPANFPPSSRCPCVSCLSGMGTPDILGGYGTFTFFSSDPAVTSRDVSGGRIRPVTIGNGHARATLDGPANDYRSDRAAASIPVDVYTDSESGAAVIEIGRRSVLLEVGEWSGWIPVAFPLLPPVSEAKGMVRLYLKGVEPHLELYVSPINLDPREPALPISSPAVFSQQLARRVGPFYTEGMPEETAGLSAGVLTDEQFLEQAEIVLKESEAAFRDSLTDYDAGFRFVYFSSVDQVSHMMWRQFEPDAPTHNGELAESVPNVIGDLYGRIDGLVGEATRALDRPDDVLIVMSDHGFTSFRRQVELNQWLRREGFLSVDAGAALSHATLADVDWSRTRAYNLGLNSIYLNLAGREREGIVPAAEADAVCKEIMDRLLLLRDPASGEPVVSACWRGKDIYTGPQVEHLPDIVVGFRPPARISWKSSLGEIPTGAVVIDNLDKWSGDHCVDPGFVPGVLFSNIALPGASPSLQDLAPTILGLYRLTPPRDMVGRSLLP